MYRIKYYFATASVIYVTGVGIVAYNASTNKKRLREANQKIEILIEENRRLLEENKSTDVPISKLEKTLI